MPTPSANCTATLRMPYVPAALPKTATTGMPTTVDYQVPGIGYEADELRINCICCAYPRYR